LSFPAPRYWTAVMRSLLLGGPRLSHSFSTGQPELGPKLVKSVEGKINAVVESYSAFGPISSPGKVVGKSGVEHSFSFASKNKDELRLVGDVILSATDEDETKVLSLFIKVYDVGAKRALLCVSPRLTPEASRLARLYNILTIESPDPRLLPGMLQDLLKRLARAP